MFSFLKKKKVETKQNPVGFVGFSSYQEFSLGREFSSFADEGYSKNAIAHRCIEYIATAVASVTISAFVYNQQGKPQKLDPIHPLNQLLRRPNPVFGGSKFFEYLISFKLIAGNAYILKNPLADNIKAPVNELWLIRPDAVVVTPGKYGFPAFYEVRNFSGPEKQRIMVDQITGYSPLMQIKNFHPLNDCLGLSKFEPAAFSVDSFNEVLKWNYKLLQRGARPSCAFVAPAEQKLSEEQLRQLEEQVINKYQGSNNAGRPLLLTGGLDFKEMQINPKDMDYINSKNSTARDICIAFGVPPQLIGLPDSQTYSNYAEAKTAFWQNTVIPILGSLVDDLNIWLSPSFGQNVYIDFDKNDIDALLPIREKQFTMLQNATFLTPNEKRELLGYDAIEGGDRLFVNAGTVPADLVDTMNQTDQQQAKKYIMKTMPELLYEKLVEEK